jgi:hypothetical protein
MGRWDVNCDEVFPKNAKKIINTLVPKIKPVLDILIGTNDGLKLDPWGAPKIWTLPKPSWIFNTFHIKNKTNIFGKTGVDSID